MQMGLQFFAKKFPSISQAKLQEGIFVSPQIKEVLKDPQFEKLLSKLELRAWQGFKWLYANFLGNAKSRSFHAGVEDQLEAYREKGCRMSLKMHLLNFLLNFFPENLDTVSDEQGEQFYQHIQAMYARNLGFWNEGMMGDYCGMLYRDDRSHVYERKSYAKHFWCHVS